MPPGPVPPPAARRGLAGSDRVRGTPCTGEGPLASIAESAWDRKALVAGARSSLLLTNLSSDALRRLLDLGSYVQAPERNHLLHDTADRIDVLLCGGAKRTATTPRGERVVTRLLGPGQAAGLLGVLGYPGIGGTIETLVPTTALLLPGPEVRRLVDGDPTLARACLRTALLELAEMRADQARLAGGSARDRIVERLAQLQERWGVHRSDEVEVTLPLTQEDLASWAGVSRESMARVLHELRSHGIVHTGRRRIRIDDPEALASLRVAPPTRAARAAMLASLRGHDLPPRRP